jgi:hypothetical protein
MQTRPIHRRGERRSPSLAQTRWWESRIDQGERRSPLLPQTGQSESGIEQGERRSPLRPSATSFACRASLSLASSPHGEGGPSSG